MRGGFSDEKWGAIARAVRAAAPVDRIVVFGSRAKGTWREGSDVDLAVYGTAWNDAAAARVKDALEEAFFPWRFDIVLPEALSDSAVVEHIERVGFEIG